MKRIFRRIVDAAMAVLMLVLMAYARMGEALHEWVGVALGALILLHLILNRAWLKSLFRGRYGALRSCLTLVDLALMGLMLVQLFSGIQMARHSFGFLPRMGRRSVARTLHLVCAYWSYVLLALHAGLHLHTAAARLQKKLPTAALWCARLLAAGIAVYGAWAFVRRELPRYMLLRVRYAFFDYAEPLIRFFADYIAIFLLFLLIGCALAGGLKRVSRRKRDA